MQDRLQKAANQKISLGRAATSGGTVRGRFSFTIDYRTFYIRLNDAP